jgi:glyoxylase-like metal-dependent hydrolase (beta-lactamase superfamily II)
MPSSPPEFQIVSPTTALWHAYDPGSKTELYSTALSSSEASCLIDPIPLDSADLQQLQARSPIRAIAVTSQNHWRTSRSLSEKLAVPIFADGAAVLPDQPQKFTAVADGETIAGCLQTITIEGGPPGEIVLFSELEGGTLIVGDALINFEPYGFTFLPSKYCENQRKMKKSLRRLAERNVERIFFAHGLPILSGAGLRLRALLDMG